MYNFAYVLTTPYSLLKSRTGGILARILSITNLDLRAVKIFAPSDRMVDDYFTAFKKDRLSEHNRDLFLKYINQNLRADNPSRIGNRCMLLVFEGRDAAGIIRRIVGHITHKPKGDTLRGTFGDFISHGNTQIYFEPAVLCASDEEAAREHLAVFKKYAYKDGGIITHCLPDSEKEKERETTLVMLKPDNFRKKSSRPGNIIDMFSKTGLYIVGAKLVQFSVAQAEDFYSPLRELMETLLEKIVRKRIKDIFISELPFEISPDDLDYIARRLRKNNAVYEFNRVIEYITGLNPTLISKNDYHTPSKEKCLAILYHGVDAVNKIRDKLGATDPQLAEEGTVRSEFGHDILRNGVHASDSTRNALRERKIVGLLGKEKSELDDILPD
jgi:nucleoside diphosphate kinase